MARFLTVCLSPVIQKTLLFNSIKLSEVNRAKEHYTDPSGKGINVTRVLRQLGADVTHLTQAGGNNGRHFKTLLKKEKINFKIVNSESSVRSCYTLLDRKNATTTEIVEESNPVEMSIERKLIKSFTRLVLKHDILVISGSKAPGYSRSVIPQMVKIAKSAGLTVILDMKGEDLLNSLQYSPDYIKHNLSEYSESFNCDKPLNSVASELAYNGIHLIVTDGINPVKFWNGSIMEETIISAVATPVNTTGCGDAFAAGFAYALSMGMNIKEAVNKGIICGNMNSRYIRPGVIEE